MDSLGSYRNIHFVGIGGAGMSAIATVLLARGFHVSGSDLSESIVTRRLAAQGARILRGHAAEHVQGADLVVTSTAIRGDNPERLAALAAEIPIWRRARALAAIMKTRKGLAVSGTHGKTTTTSMMSLAMLRAGLDPTALIGGDVDALGGNARNGAGPWCVAEADESDGSFLEMEPDGIIVTNIEADHLDFYRDLAHVTETFEAFLARLSPGGRAVGCADSEPVARLMAPLGGRALMYSTRGAKKADLVARDIRILAGEGGLRFTPVLRGGAMAPVRMKVPGRHNVANALAVILMGLEVGCPYEAIQTALGEYAGARRRFQLKGCSHGVTVIDDYAHHPTEILATLSAGRERLQRKKPSRIVSVFQPHRYSRTASLASEFGKSFGEADLAVVTDVYAAGEDPIEGVSGERIVEFARTAGHPNVHYVAKSADVVEFLRSKLREGDLVFTLGAGDVWRVGENILTALESPLRDAC